MLISQSKWWSATNFLHNEVILEILSFVLFLGGAMHVWDVCNVIPVENTMVNVTVNVVSHTHIKWWPITKFLYNKIILEI